MKELKMELKDFDTSLHHRFDKLYLPGFRIEKFTLEVRKRLLLGRLYTF